jgi:antiviral helicase SKI2
VRGKSGYVPFWPGGLEDVLNPGRKATNDDTREELKTIPPGFSRGLRLPGDETENITLFHSYDSKDVGSEGISQTALQTVFVLQQPLKIIQDIDHSASPKEDENESRLQPPGQVSEIDNLLPNTVRRSNT